jgi:hypothetical protein
MTTFKVTLNLVTVPFFFSEVISRFLLHPSHQSMQVFVDGIEQSMQLKFSQSLTNPTNRPNLNFVCMIGYTILKH